MHILGETETYRVAQDQGGRTRLYRSEQDAFGNWAWAEIGTLREKASRAVSKEAEMERKECIFHDALLDFALAQRLTK